MIKPVFTSMARGHPSNSCAANARRHKQIICHIKNARLEKDLGRLSFANCQVRFMDMHYSQHCTLQNRIDGD